MKTENNNPRTHKNTFEAKTVLENQIIPANYSIVILDLKIPSKSNGSLQMSSRRTRELIVLSSIDLHSTTSALQLKYAIIVNQHEDILNSDEFSSHVTHDLRIHLK